MTRVTLYNDFITAIRTWLVASLLAGSLAAMGLWSPATAGTGAVVKVSECGLKAPKAKPSSIILTCADAGVVLNHLKWRYWGSDIATAVGK